MLEKIDRKGNRNKNTKWTDEDNTVLIDYEAAENKMMTFRAIAQKFFLHSHSEKSCSLQYSRLRGSREATSAQRQWEEAEDSAIADMYVNGDTWKSIAAAIPRCTPKDVHDRYYSNDLDTMRLVCDERIKAKSKQEEMKAADNYKAQKEIEQQGAIEAKAQQKSNETAATEGLEKRSREEEEIRAENESQSIKAKKKAARKARKLEAKKTAEEKARRKAEKKCNDSTIPRTKVMSTANEENRGVSSEATKTDCHWTSPEIAILCEKRIEFGEDHKKIAPFVPGRTEAQVRDFCLKFPLKDNVKNEQLQ